MEFELLCFSYGSNMSLRRLRKRVPSARSVATARLAGHKLVFHKRSKDGSAKCDAMQTGFPQDYVMGVVFEILHSEKQKLDQNEGLGLGYEEKTVTVLTIGGENLRALMYYAIDIDSSLKPYGWYKQHVLVGAREHNLPTEYIRIIESVQSIDDPRLERHEIELSIYR